MEGSVGYLKGKTPFANAFPLLYSHSSFHNMHICHFFSIVGGSISWKFHFFRFVDDRDLDDLVTLHILDPSFHPEILTKRCGGLENGFLFLRLLFGAHNFRST